jgi:glucokinase
MEKQKQVILGIDIGGTNVAFGLIGKEEKKILWKDSEPIVQFATAEALADTIAQKMGCEFELVGIGIGAPNGNFYTGSIEFAPNLPWKGIVPLKQIFEAKFGVPVFVSNDANAAACGEFVFGKAGNHPHFLMITLGTGVGSGLFVDGKLVLGSDGMAGELGHFMVVPNGRPCGCGRNGCLEAYASSTALIKQYLEKADNMESITAKDVVDRWQKGDPIATEVMENTIEILGWSLANFVTIHSPSMIVLFGGWAQSGETVMGKIRHSFESNLLKIYRGKVELVPSLLAGSDAALLGAASLGF